MMPRRLWLIPFFFLLGGVVVFIIPHLGFLRRPDVQDGSRFGRILISEPTPGNNLPYRLKPLPNIHQIKKDLAIGKFGSLEELLEKSGTLALLVVRRDTVVYENYFNGFNCDTVTQIFSATKPMVVSLLTIAMDEGSISSLDQPVSDFLPEFNIGDYKKITLRHLAQMRSGFDYDEYRKILGTLRFYYRRNLSAFLHDPHNLRLKFAPGEKFTYKSVDTQILGMCLEKATGVTLQEYFYDKIWRHIGAEDPAFWSIGDRETGMLKFYGGLNISVKDMSKLGIMYMHNGKYHDKQILPESWVNYCDADSNRNGQYKYCMGWWYDLNEPDNNIYFGAGFGGQILFINETTETVIVRLGTKKASVPWYDLFKEISVASL